MKRARTLAGAAALAFAGASCASLVGDFGEGTSSGSMGAGGAAAAASITAASSAATGPGGIGATSGKGGATTTTSPTSSTTAGSGGASGGGGAPASATSGTAAGGTGGKSGATSTTGASGKGGATTTTGNGGKGGASTTTGPGGNGGGCPAPSTCVLVPQGWSGPVALESGASPPTCTEADWPTPAITGGTSIDAPEACTACTCLAPQGATCPTSAAVSKFGLLNCLGSITLDTLSTTCSQGISGYAALEGPPTSASGTCGQSEATVTTPATFSAYAAGCSGGALGSCPGGLCAKPASRTCIYTTGLPSCPLEYSHAVVLFGAISDLRGCGACSCGPATGVTCKPTAQVFSSADCSGAPGTLLSSGLLDGSTCVLPGGGASSARISDVGTPAGGSCSSGGGAPSGSATGVSPITMCCSS